MKQSFKQFLKYGIVGVIGLCVEWGFFFILRDLYDVDYVIAHVVGSALAIVNNFILNSYFTFRTTDQLLKRAISFGGIAGVGLLLGYLLLPGLVALFNTYSFGIFNPDDQKMIQNVAKLFTTVIVAFLQFFFNKYHTFKTAKCSE